MTSITPPTPDSTTPPPGTGNGPSAPVPGKLRGSLGALAIIFTVLAFNAPLGVAGGFVPVVIGNGNHEGAPATFIVIAVMLVLFSVGLLAMSRFMHSCGAFYSYIVAGLGRVIGLGGAYTAIAAYTAFCCCGYAFCGLVTRDLMANAFPELHVAWWVWSLVFWVAATTLSLFNINLSAKILGIALIAEIGVALVWGLRVFFNGGPSGVSLHPLTPSAFFGGGSVSVALLFAAMCITGFEAVAVFREEARDPVKTVRRATYGSVIFMCAFYAFVAWAYLTAYGSDAVAQGQADPIGSFKASVLAYAGTVAYDAVSVLLLTSGFASALANVNIGARYLFTLGGDGVLPRKLGKVHPKQGSPYVAAAVFSTVCLIGAIVIPALFQIEGLTVYVDLAAIGGVCLLLLMLVTSVAVPVFFRRTKGHTASVWESVIAPSLATAALAVVFSLSVIHMPDIIGADQTVANIALAVIAFFAIAGIGNALYFRSRKPEIFRLIGRQDL
jgi:amino acid transporter